jgi:hypothetical protein
MRRQAIERLEPQKEMTMGTTYKRADEATIKLVSAMLRDHHLGKLLFGEGDDA